MEPDDSEDSDKKIGHVTTKITTTITLEDIDSSLSLSLTPPDLVEKKTEKKVSEKFSDNEEESISEHLSSVETSVENDRSLQEIEVDTFIPGLDSDEDNVRISQEGKPSLVTTSFQTEPDSVITSEIISLTALDTFGLMNEEHREMKSILEEIINSSHSETLSRKSKEDSFDIFTNLDLEDKSLAERIIGQSNKENRELDNRRDSNLDRVSKQVEDLEELLKFKDKTIVELTSELDSSKSLSSGASTEYKQLHEDYQKKCLEYTNEIERRDDLICQLTESLQQSIANREELRAQVDHFKNELEHLQVQLQKTTDIVLSNEAEDRVPDLDVIKMIEQGTSPVLTLADTKFETEFSKLEGTLSIDQLEVMRNIKNDVNIYIESKINESKKENEEIVSNLKISIREERDIHDKEIARLRELLANMKSGSSEIMELRLEIESKHQKEMEELRRYFEKKCTDLEKNYSDEIFSHHSRKRSGSNSSSENDLPIDVSGLPSRPGPGGDAPSSLDSYRIDYKQRALQNLTKLDLLNLRQDMANLLDIFEKYDVDCCSNENLTKMKQELGDYDVKNLFKIEMEAFRNEMKNKYNAELEILNQDYENKVDLLKVQQEERLSSTKAKYLEEIEGLKEILNRTNKGIQYSTAVQEVGSSGEFEINEVVQSYERRLQEQVAMAKIDIISVFENQIQRLAANEGSDEEWPQDLLTLRDRFAERYEKQILELRKEHQNEVARLKEEYIKNLNGAIERARRRSLKDGDSLTDVKVVEERDHFKKRANLLRNLLGELLKYFTQCEDEVNNTIVDELVRQAAEKNLTDIEKELNDSSSSFKTDSSSVTAPPTVKRVHLAPNFKDLMSLLELSSEKDSESRELSEDLKNELESCLEKLKAEANAVLALSFNVSKRSEPESVKESVEASGSLNRKLIEEVNLRIKLNEEVEGQKDVIESLERERSVLEAQVVELIERLNVTQGELERAQLKISEILESGQREIVSEGYGGVAYAINQEEGNAVKTFNKIQEKARGLLMGTKTHDPTLLQLLEELVTVGEKMIEESKMERRDLQQQIDVADKKYKQTCKFLEEQAADRELERDDSQRQILALQEQLKFSDKNRAIFANINEEVEHLESQIRESSKISEKNEFKLREIEKERDEAVEKIFFLRDVIRELESEVKSKTETEAELRSLIAELERLISQKNQGGSLEKAGKDDGDDESERIKEYIQNLERTIEKLQQGKELVETDAALRELRNQLADIEAVIEKRTKELEEQSSPISTTTCSSPSEDMSVRDVVRSKTPSNMALNDCEIPLQQLARLKEKLVRHSRAEDAALKRIRDLEMQVFNLKAANEEYYTERDILKKEIADQLVLISSLQIRLDDQRIRAEHIEKQANCSLESRIYDLQKEITDLQESLQTRNNTISHLNGLVDDLRKKIEEKENEADSTSDDEMIITMQKEIEHLRNQNELLHKRLNSSVDIIPNLVENIISDKNTDIESLRQKLESTEKQLEMYNSLSLDRSQLFALKNLRNSGTSLTEVLSVLELSTPDQARRATESESMEQLNLLQKKTRKNDDTVFLSTEDTREISSIQKDPTDVHFLSISPFGRGKKNSTELSRSCEKHVHFDLSGKEKFSAEIQHLLSELERLKLELEEKNDVIKQCNERLKTLEQLERNIDFVQSKLEETQETLKNVTENFEKELSKREEAEKDLRIELVQKKINAEEQEKEIQLLRDDSVRKDDMYLKLAKETKNLKKEKEKLEENIREYKELEEIMSVKNNIILELETQISDLRKKESDEEKSFHARLKDNEEECESLKLRLDSFSKENEHKDQLIEKLLEEKKKLTDIVKIETEKSEKLKKDISNKVKQIEEFEKRTESMERKIRIVENENCNLNEEIKAQRDTIVNKDSQFKNLQNENEKLKKGSLKELERKIFELQEVNSLKIAEIDELTDKLRSLDEELRHAHELSSEKDKIIAQFKKDSEHLQMSLETIQNKMRENGNIIDLSKRLREEQMKNSELLEEIQIMKAQMMSYGVLDRDVMVASIEEIAGKVKKELDNSAQIDSNIISAAENIENAELQDTIVKLKLKHSDLNRKYQELQERCKMLENDLEKKRYELDAVQLEDANLIEQLRIQLESASENEIELEKMVESWKKRVEILEIEVSKLKSQLSNVNSKSESTEYKNLPTKESQELLVLKREVSGLNEELDVKKVEFKKVKKEKRELETNLTYTKHMVDLKNREIKDLEGKVGEGLKKEHALMERVATLNEQLKTRSKEVENSRILIDDLEQEMKGMKQQIATLNENLKAVQEQKRKSSPKVPNTSLPIADQLMNKIEEINSTVKNDRRTMELIIRLTNDNKILKNRVQELENEGTNNVPFENPMNRANYLFAKCLRVESYRKALIWQKRYLISLLGSYQYTTDLGPMEKLQGQKKIRFSGIRKFRRWHSGAKLAENVNARYLTMSLGSQRSTNSNQAGRVGHFQVGQPVSRQQFAPSMGRSSMQMNEPLGNNSEETVLVGSESRLNGERETPWSGATPPCREKSSGRTRLTSNLGILKAPQLLNQYAERYSKIQENLEMLLNTEPST